MVMQSAGSVITQIIAFKYVLLYLLASEPYRYTPDHGRFVMHYTEKNVIFRKILILHRLISQIIICLLELHLAVNTNIECFIPNWDFRFVNKCISPSFYINILRRKYFSGRSLFVTLKYCSISDKADAFFGSLGGGGEEVVAIRGFLK